MALHETVALRLLNLGCGSCFHPAWINMDFVSTDKRVIAHDLTKGIPLRSGTCDAVYHSHLLEHFPRRLAGPFLSECRRVLGPGKVLRVVVPDFEALARAYLEHLGRALEGDAEAARRYDWLAIELFDQMTRHAPGGEMLEYWKQNPMPAEEYVYERLGTETQRLVARLRASDFQARPAAIANDPAAVGLFRTSGEPHLWMYDRWSLGRLLGEAGFQDVRVTSADASDIPGFQGYHLDCDADGRVRKQDSLYMEARK